MSACTSRSSALAGCGPQRATPMLAEARSERPSISAGSSSTSMRRWDSASTSSVPSGSSNTSSANSSPPRRATRSFGRRQASRRAATVCSSLSPAAWPSVSLTSLKWSRSSASSATSRRCASAARSAACSVKRLARPVSESVWARWRRRSCAITCSVTSAITPRQPAVRPSSSTRRLPLMAQWRGPCVAAADRRNSLNGRSVAIATRSGATSAPMRASRSRKVCERSASSPTPSSVARRGEWCAMQPSSRVSHSASAAFCSKSCSSTAIMRSWRLASACDCSSAVALRDMASVPRITISA